MPEYINKNSSEKAQAVKGVGVRFQKFYFRPCIGLNHFIRWGRWCLDLRPIAAYLGIDKITISARTQVKFEKEIEPLLSVFPCDPVLLTFIDAEMVEVNRTNQFNPELEILRIRELKKMYNKTVAINTDDDLPF